MLPALEGTLADLGIDLRAQRNVHLDVEERPTKDPRAFCAPIEVPGRVMLVIKPVGGYDDWLALFHEAGHAEHFASHVGPPAARGAAAGRQRGHRGLGLPARAPRDGSRVAHPAARRGSTRGARIRVERGPPLLRPPLLREAPLRAGTARRQPGRRLGARYVELLSDATKIEYAPADFLADVDPGFYCTNYLRAWALEAQLVAHLREEYGRSWFAERRAGSLLRELWSEGQGLDADALVREVTGGPLEFDTIRERIEEYA